MTEIETHTTTEIPGALPDGNGSFKLCPNLLTEDELIRFLRIPEVSKSQNHHNVIAHLKRYRKLPCIHISHKPLYPLEAVLGWIGEINQKEMNR
jgi:hypothetical protein